jgi:hypothetical protein
MKRSPLAAAVLACAAAHAQDSLAVAFNGGVYHLDTTIPRITSLGGTGLIGHNALARDASGNFWSTNRANSSFSLVRIDPATGTATVRFPIPDARGLAAAGGTELYLVHEPPLPQTIDIFARVDTLTGTVTEIGPTGFTGLQGLAGLGNLLFAWDINLGLITIDPRTGIGTDVNPGLGGPLLQTLWAQPDGRLFGASGGTTQLYAIDIGTGNAVGVGGLGSNFDLRGVESFGGFSAPLGTGCAGAAGTVVMSVGGMLTNFGRITTLSRNHAPNAIGVQVLGFSSTSMGGIPLPLLLDPILGTVNCNLYVSMDLTQAATTSSGTPATLGFQTNLPMAARGVTLFAQHACFEPVPGGLSLSNAARIQIAP